MNEVEQGEVDRYISPAKLKGAPAIELAHRMNERCIDLFCELAIERPPDVHWPFLVSNRDLWARLGTDTRGILATFPYVLVDVRFGDIDWWQSAGRSKPASNERNAAQMAPSTSGREWLALEALMFAWQVARDDPRIAHIAFAMAPTVAACVATLSMQQIRTIGIQSANELRVRWDDKPKFWRELLIAAADRDEAAMLDLKLHAGRRFLGEVRSSGGG